MKFNPSKNHRILLIDDNLSIHDAFRKILDNPSVPDVLRLHEVALFGQPAEDSKIQYLKSTPPIGERKVWPLLSRAFWKSGPTP